MSFGVSIAALLGGIGLLGSRQLAASERRLRSELARDTIVLAIANGPRDAAQAAFLAEFPTLLPDDRLLVRFHLAKAALRTREFPPLLDSVQRRGLAPAESLLAWRMLPLEASLIRRMASSEPPEGDLDSIDGLARSCLERDSTLLDCHVVGILVSALDRNWSDFGRRTDRALELRPGDFRLQGFHGIQLLLDGDFARARAWIPDVRSKAGDSASMGELLRWSSSLFEPWLQAIRGEASGSLEVRMGIPDEIRRKLTAFSRSRSADPSPSDGFVACSLAPDTYGTLFVCRPQVEKERYPLHGKDAPLRDTASLAPTPPSEALPP